MEGYCSESFIVEFNGIPGTGKSTLADEINKIARPAGWNVCRNYQSGTLERKPYLSLLKTRSYTFLPTLLRLGRLSEMTKERAGQIIRCLGYINSYIQFRQDHPASTMYVLDEGIIQSLVSIAFLEPFKGKEFFVKKLFSLLKKKKVQWYSINCISDTQISYERIINRGDNKGRMDLMRGEELIKALNSQAESFNLVRNEAKESGVLTSSIDIDTNLTPNFNAKIIMNWINNNISHVKDAGQ